MRSFFVWVGVAAMALAVIVAGGVAYMVHLGSGLDKESRAYAESAVTAITSTWDSQALTNRASLALLKLTPPDRLGALFGWFSSLGKLTSQQDCTGQASVFAMAGQPTRTLAHCRCDEQYEHGAATVSLSLIKGDNGWEINGFNVSSPALIPGKRL
jgi:hypothetical protein